MHNTLPLECRHIEHMLQCRHIEHMHYEGVWFGKKNNC